MEARVDQLLQQLADSSEVVARAASSAVRGLQDFIENLPSRHAQPPNQASRLLWEDGNIEIPYPEQQPRAAATPALAFAPPTLTYPAYDVAPVSLRGEQAVADLDIVVIMPSKLFQEIDCMNYSYFCKRAFYLACIASALRADQRLGIDTNFSYSNDNPLQPKILTSLKLALGDGRMLDTLRVGIVCMIAEHVLPKEALYPWKGCVAPQQSSQPSGRPALEATPFHNSTLRSECSSAIQVELIKSRESNFPGLRQASELLALWLCQRGLSSAISKGGFGAFEAALVLAMLLGPPHAEHVQGWREPKAASHGLSLFKSLLRFIASVDLNRHPLVLNGASEYAENIKQLSGPVLFDGQSGMNVLYKMSKPSYRQLQFEAQATLECLERPVDNFMPTFIWKNADLRLQFDYWLESAPHYVHISQLTKARCIPDSDVESKAIQPTDTSMATVSACGRVFSVLQTALGDRVKLICVRSQSPGPWNLDSSAPSVGRPRIRIGLVADYLHAQRLVDRGPRLGDAATAFRDFWGAKAELRRFRDGTTRESLVWSDDPTHGDTIQQITNFVLERHLGSSPTAAATWTNACAGHGSLEQVERAVVDLKQAVEKLAELPLKVRDLRLTTPRCRFCEPLASTTDQSSRLAVRAEINVQLEGSSRWPGDFGAIQMTKCAFLLKVGALLRKTWTNCVTTIGLEAAGSSHRPSSPHLDIVVDAVTLRLRLFLERETTLLDRLLPAGDSRAQRKELVAQTRFHNIRTMTMAPRHATAMDALCIKFPSMGRSVALLRHWCASHLLSNHIQPELLEIFVACVFTCPHPYAIPACPRSGFFRTLALLARWDWTKRPLIVELDSKISSTEAAAIELRFRAWRKIDPIMNRVALIVGTSLDLGGVIWTEGKIPSLIAARLRALAQASVARIQEESLHIPKSLLFATPLSQYDFLVRLRPQGGKARTPSTLRSVNSTNESCKTSYYWDTVQSFMTDLSRQYKDIVLFFHGDEQAVIAGLWSPFRSRQQWRAVSDCSTIPIGSPPNTANHMLRAEAAVDYSRNAILNEIARLGEGLVLTVTLGTVGRYSKR